MADVFYPGLAAGDAASIGEDGVVEAVVTPNAAYQVFELSDATFTTPLTIKTPAGLTDTKVPVGALPIFPDVYVVSPNFAHNWKSGDLVFRRDSQDAKDKAVADALALTQQIAAETPQRVEVEVAAVAATGAFKGDPGKDGSNVVPTAQAIATEIQTPGTPANTALSATIAERVESINVKTFGATGDGVTDDRAAIQSAVNHLRADGRTGGVIYFPIGEYRVSNTVKVPTGVTLRGAQGGFWVYASIGRSRIFIDPSVNAPVLQNASAFTTYDANITIEKLYIDGTTAGTAFALDMRGASRASERFIISDCFITSLGGGGIHFQNVQTSIVRNSYVSNTKDTAIWFDNCYDNELSGNQLDTFNSTTQAVNPGDGIRLSGVSPNNIIANNFVFLCNRGIAVLDGHTNTFTGNRVNTCNIGILLQNFVSAVTVRQNTFVGNALYDHGFANTFVAILVDGLASANTFVGNTIGETRTGTARTQNYGIRATASTAGNIFTGNVASNSKTLNFEILGNNTHYGNSEGAQGGFWVGDGQRIEIGTTTGSQIGRTTSKLAFFGSTPVAKPSGIPAAATDLASAIALANDMRAKWISLGLST